MPTSRRAYVGEALGRLLLRRVLLCVAYRGGGAFVFAGGFVLMVSAGGGWRRFRAALGDWLGGP